MLPADKAQLERDLTNFSCVLRSTIEFNRDISSLITSYGRDLDSVNWVEELFANGSHEPVKAIVRCPELSIIRVSV
jgi:hypothetical protein